MTDIYIFKRVEKKYILDAEKKTLLLSKIEKHLTPDVHGVSTVCSMYLDTPNFLLIRNSIDADSYKEKLRLRSYGLPSADTKVFFEIKKKFCGTVYKRRISMKFCEALDYINGGELPETGQIAREIDYAMKLYGSPRVRTTILCEREAYTAAFDEVPPDVSRTEVRGAAFEAPLRLTFDSAVRYKSESPEEMRDLDGTRLLPAGVEILEIKTAGAMPLWLSHALDECGIFPQSFSKYGSAFLDMTGKDRLKKGDGCYV